MASGGTGKWKLVKSFSTSQDDLLLCSLISDDEICAVDENYKVTYVTNINTKHTKRVIADTVNINQHDWFTASCASVDKNVIVCGKQRGGSTGDIYDECITLYDRQWKVIRDISIPTEKRSNALGVEVDVDNDGMILAAQHVSSNIYVINPANGKIVKTIKMQKGKSAMGEIQSLSSGDIVVRTYDNEFTVISRSGKEKAVIHRDDECSYCSVDKRTDILYITYLDSKSICAVDQVSCDGIIKAKGIVEYRYKHDDESLFSKSCVTSSGNLVCYNDSSFYVYKKK